MNVTRVILLGAAVCFFLGIAAQEDRRYSARQLKTLALSAERMSDPQTATIYFEKYLEKRPSDLKATYRLAENYRRIGSFESAKSKYRSIYIEDNKKFPLAAFYYAEMLSTTGECSEAIPIYRQFRKDYRGEKDDRKFLRLAKYSVEGCEKGKLDSTTVSKMAVRALPKDINGEHIQGAPIYLPDGQLVYNSLKTNGEGTFDVKLDSMPERKFYATTYEAGVWKDTGFWKLTNNFTEKEVANGAFNMEGNRFYFSACKRTSFGKVDCDIYRMEKVGELWSLPEPLSTINTKATETQVAVGLDEKERETVYFVSDRRGGKGGLDIWYTTYYKKKDTYKTARNCGSKINSVGDEITPFIDPLNRKLIFSSDGHPGNGGFDVFKSPGQRSRWSEPENIGKEINTAADELYYVVDPKGGEGIFASNRPKVGDPSKKYCCDDLYHYKETNRIKVYLKGIVRASTKGNSTKTVKNAKLKVYQVDPKTEEFFLVQSKNANDDGSFDFTLEPNEKYVVRTEGEGFLTNEEQVSTSGIMNDKEINIDINLEEYKDKNIPIGNVYFQFNKAELTEESKKAIDIDLLRTLQNNPSIIVEISSHTDSKGTEAYNLNLSQKRSDALTKYLRSKGIDKKRLKSVGYGESKPIAPNENPDGSDNPEGRKKNRRVEFKVIGEVELPDADELD